MVCDNCHAEESTNIHAHSLCAQCQINWQRYLNALAFYKAARAKLYERRDLVKDLFKK